MSLLNPIPIEAQSFNVRDYFLLSPGDQWHLQGLADEGSGPETDFTYAVQSGTVLVAGGRRARAIQTTFDEGVGPRHLDRDLFYIDSGSRSSGQPDSKAQESPGALLYCGIQYGTPLNLGGLMISEVILSDPVFLGGDSEVIGGNNGMDTGTAILPLVGSATVHSNVSYIGIETITVPLGTFRDVLHISLDITIDVPIFGTYNFLQNELWFARGVGLIRQRQVLTPDLTVVQGLDSGQVDGNPIAAPTCTIEISPPTSTLTHFGGMVNFQVTTPFLDCEWIPVSNKPWIIIDAFGGTGSGQVGFHLSPNPTGQVRTGSIDISGEVHSITQSGLPDASLLLDHLLGKAPITMPQLPESDINQDDIIDVADLILLHSILAGQTIQ